MTHAAIDPEDPDRRLPRPKTATVIAEDDRLRLVIPSEGAGVLPRTTTREVHRSKGLRSAGLACAGHSLLGLVCSAGR